MSKPADGAPPPVPHIPLVPLALDWLQKGKGKETYTFHPRGKEALQLGLQTVFASGLDPKPALLPLLGLAHVLQKDENSPTAARLIISVVAGDQRARTVLGVTGGHEAYLAKAGEFLQGRGARALAPQVGAKKPKGAIKLSDLAPPGSLVPGGRLR